MGALSTAVAFGAGYVVGANRDSVVGKVKAKARSVASDLKTRVGRIGGSTANTVIDVRQVSEVMTGVLETVRPSSTLAEAARRMRDGDIGDVLVAKAEGNVLVGIVTDRDIAIRAVAAGDDPSTTTVKSIMTDNVESVSPRDTIEEAKARMGRANIRRLPVVENGKLVGVLSLGDLSLATETGATLADISVASPDR
jgi:CBS domain-containing protein